MGRSYLVLLLALSAIWGASYLFIKVGVRDLEPAAFVELRLLFARARRLPRPIERRPRRGSRPPRRSLSGFRARGDQRRAQLILFRMLRLHGSARTSLVTYLLPPIALVYGVALLGEPLTAHEIGGMVLIMLGIAVGSGAARLPRRTPATQTP